MSSKNHRELKNARVRRMLLMVDNTVEDSEPETHHRNSAEMDANTSTSTSIQSLPQDPESDALCKSSCQESSAVETSSDQTLSKCYKLRDLPKIKYVDGDRESHDEDFSPDCSEYIPSPRRNTFDSPLSTVSSLSGDSQCISRMLLNPEINNTPSTISNLSLYLTNINFVASPSVVYKATSVLSPVVHLDKETENQSIIKSSTEQISRQEDEDIINQSIKVTQSISNHSLSEDSRSDADETLQPEQSMQNGELPLNNQIDVTLTDDTQNDCAHGEDRTEIVRNFNIDINNDEVDNCTNEFNLENQQEPSTSEGEKRLTRKRKQNVNEWRCNKNKILKNSGKDYEGCNSKKKYPKKSIGPTCACKKGCGEKFSLSERQNIFDKFYSLADREHQWLYIGRHIQTEPIKRMTLERKNNRTQTVKYLLPLNDKKVLVCKIFFLNTLQIGEQMVYAAIEKMNTESDYKDKRGTHDNRPRKLSTITEGTIKAHIELFPKVESHYTRMSSKREYLSEYLNISKMYRFYTVWFAQQGYTDDVVMASKRQYETVFNTQYNYSFFKPKKDQCPSCSVYNQADPELKVTLEEKHRCHLAKKEIIRRLKREEIDTADKNNTTIAIFDLQKVLNIPQSEVGTFHYKRKYPVYNFTVFDALRKIGYCYVWHYQIAKRGSTEIGSCLLSFFKTENDKGITKFSLYSDGCYGQNKNRYIFALYVYAAKLLSITITHRFFETGHSQNEGDSMHACIEKNLQNKVLYTPDQIYSIILNSKISGEKYRLKELEQSDIYDIKPLVDANHWRRDVDGNIIRWADVMEVNVTQESKLLYKYNFNDTYSELDLNNSHTALNARRRGRKRTQDVAIGLNNVELQNAYHQPILISKPLHTDLMSLCKSGAIPRFYHPFYESLSYTDTTNDNIIDTDED